MRHFLIIAYFYFYYDSVSDDDVISILSRRILSMFTWLIGITFDGIYHISDVTDEENTKETEAACMPSDEEMVASCEAIEESDNNRIKFDGIYRIDEENAKETG